MFGIFEELDGAGPGLSEPALVLMFGISEELDGTARGWGVGAPSHFRKHSLAPSALGLSKIRFVEATFLPFFGPFVGGCPSRLWGSPRSRTVPSKGGGGARGGGVWAPPHTLCFRLRLNPLRGNDHFFHFLVCLWGGTFFHAKSASWKRPLLLFFGPFARGDPKNNDFA